MADSFSATGGCVCDAVRYTLTVPAMFTHCCHCRYCQRETGSAFALNAIVETSAIIVDAGKPKGVKSPSASGRGQMIMRCPECDLALWSHYAGAGPAIAFLRASTLDDTDLIRPDIHIYTQSKQPWLRIEPEIPIVKQYYRRAEYWPQESIQRWNEARQ